MKKIVSLLLLALVCAILVFPAVAETVETVAAAADPAPAFTVDLTQIIVSVIGLVFSFLLTWLIRAVVPPVKKWLESKTTAQQRDILTNLTRQLVLAAEQTIGAGQGRKKMDYVCNQLKARGYTIDMDVIEASVKEMNDMLLAELTTGEPIHEAYPTAEDNDWK